MMVKMGDGEHARALMRFLDAELEARGIAPSTWARDNNISPATFTRWRNGEIEPTIAAMVQVAKALDRSVADLIVAAGYTDADNLGAPPVVPSELPTIDVALMTDPDPLLTPADRDQLRGLVELIRAGRRGTRR